VIIKIIKCFKERKKAKENLENRQKE